MNIEDQLNLVGSLKTDMNWAQAKLNMVVHDIKNDSSGGVSNEMSEVIMSLEFALQKAKLIKSNAKR